MLKIGNCLLYLYCSTLLQPAKVQLMGKIGELQGWWAGIWGSSGKDLFTRQFLVRCGGRRWEGILKPLHCWLFALKTESEAVTEGNFRVDMFLEEPLSATKHSSRIRFARFESGLVKIYKGTPPLKHRKNCECCHHHSLFKGHNVTVNIVVLKFQKWNQCLKCQVSGHKFLGLLFEGVL